MVVNTELVIDLAKLAKKHGASSFEQLAEFLRNPTNVNDLVLILENSSKLDNVSHSKNPKKKRQESTHPVILDKLKDSDPEKYEFLNQFYLTLISKQILTTQREINFFREDNGLKSSKTKSHNESVNALINDLVNFPLEKLTKMETSVSEGKGLQGWSDIILNRK